MDNLSKSLEGARVEGFNQGYAQAVGDLEAYYGHNKGRTGSAILANALKVLQSYTKMIKA